MIMYQFSIMFCNVEHLPTTCVCSIILIIYFCHMCSFCCFFICLIIHVHIFLYIAFIVFLNKLQALVQGHTKIPGGECHRCQNGGTKDM